MVDLKPTSKKTMQAVFAEAGERKIVLAGPQTKLQDSRFAVADAALDHVAIKMLGDGELLVIPYTSITSLKVERQLLTIAYR